MDVTTFFEVTVYKSLFCVVPFFLYHIMEAIIIYYSLFSEQFLVFFLWHRVMVFQLTFICDSFYLIDARFFASLNEYYELEKLLTKVEKVLTFLSLTFVKLE